MSTKNNPDSYGDPVGPNIVHCQCVRSAPTKPTEIHWCGFRLIAANCSRRRRWLEVLGVECFMLYGVVDQRRAVSPCNINMLKNPIKNKKFCVPHTTPQQTTAHTMCNPQRHNHSNRTLKDENLCRPDTMYMYITTLLLHFIEKFTVHSVVLVVFLHYR